MGISIKKYFETFLAKTNFAIWSMSRTSFESLQNIVI